MSSQQGSTDKTLYATQKTAKLAYKKVGNGDWEAIDPKAIPADVERTGHEKIGEKWLTVLSSK